MALGPQERQRLVELETFQQRVQHLHGLVERFAAERQDLEPHINAIRRAFNRLKMELAGAGFDSMSQLCSSLDTAAKRTGSKPFKARILREGIGSLRMQLDVEQRSVRAMDQGPPVGEEAKEE
jgi:chemotaxis protein histidine kinase CheA